MSKSEDIVEALRIEDQRRVVLSYRDFINHAEEAYNRAQVCKMLGVGKDRMREYMGISVVSPDMPSSWTRPVLKDPIIPIPQYITRDRGFGTEHRMFFSRKEILDARDAIQKYRSQRKYGSKTKTTAVNTLPSKQELMAKLNGTNILFVKTGTGDFVPLFLADRKTLG